MFQNLKNPNALFSAAVFAALGVSVAVVMATLTEAVVRSQAFL
jgi:hypothetical protein